MNNKLTDKELNDPEYMRAYVGELHAVIGELLASPPPAATLGKAEHPDDIAVDVFAVELKAKLAKAREKGRGGWQGCDPAVLSRMLREHVEKGDPRDVANFCMFLWHLNAPIAQQPAASDVRDAALDEAITIAAKAAPEGFNWVVKLVIDQIRSAKSAPAVQAGEEAK